MGMESNSARSSGQWIRIGRHAVFWLIAFSAMLPLYARMLESGAAVLWLLAAMSPLFVTAVYFTLYVTLPRALYPRRYALLIQLVLYTLLGIVFLELSLFLLLVVRVLPFPDIPGYEPPAHAYDAVLLSAGPIIVTLAAVAVKLVRRAQESERTALRLRQEKLQAELSMLRAQVHPHFLFNTLNSLYALTLRKSDRAPEAVLQLSALLDYMLHESTAETVAVEREAAVIEQYLALERLRHGEDLAVSFEQSLEAPRRVPPLLFLPLVENSFKHGVSRCPPPAWVRITLRCDSRALEFTVVNAVPHDANGAVPGTDDIPREGGGLGLRNVRERLALHYPGAHEFHAAREGDRFTASIRIRFPVMTPERP